MALGALVGGFRGLRGGGGSDRNEVCLVAKSRNFVQFKLEVVA
jgi:hypothetical protein